MKERFRLRWLEAGEQTWHDGASQGGWREACDLFFSRLRLAIDKRELGELELRDHEPRHSDIRSDPRVMLRAEIALDALPNGELRRSIGAENER